MLHPEQIVGRSREPLGRVLMVQGTSSYVGKTTLVTALCRLFADAGYRVAPFKAQNMSNNAAVTPGGEIGRAQAVQAMAARATPIVDMNPILLKPTGDQRSQVVVLGRVWRTLDAREYYANEAVLWPAVTAALDRLRAANDIVVIEGAGSPAEINLAEYDLVNMRVARYADAPVLLVGDIDRGGVFAALYGTVALLTPEERSYIRGFVINKFRGDPSLLAPAFAMLQQQLGIPTLGVLPYLDLARLPAEDGLELDARGRFASPYRSGNPAEAVIDIAVLRFPRIANLDEFQPLANESGVNVRFVRDPGDLGTPDLIILPGTKSTVADLAWMRDRGLDRAIRSSHAAGTPVLGICGGYQMLGRRIVDAAGVEAQAVEVSGLDLLPVVTTFTHEKVTERVNASVGATGAFWSRPTGGFQTDERSRVGPLAPYRPAEPRLSVEAYEIHMGRSEPVPGAEIGEAPFVVESVRGGGRVANGLASVDGSVVGTYLHGLFENSQFRRQVLAALAERKGATLPSAPDLRGLRPADTLDAAFDELAAAVRRHLDLDAVMKLMGPGGSTLGVKPSESSARNVDGHQISGARLR